MSNLSSSTRDFLHFSTKTLIIFIFTFVSINTFSIPKSYATDDSFQCLANDQECLDNTHCQTQEDPRTCHIMYDSNGNPRFVADENAGGLGKIDNNTELAITTVSMIIISLFFVMILPFAAFLASGYQWWDVWGYALTGLAHISGEIAIYSLMKKELDDFNDKLGVELVDGKYKEPSDLKGEGKAHDYYSKAYNYLDDSIDATEEIKKLVQAKLVLLSTVIAGYSAATAGTLAVLAYKHTNPVGAASVSESDKGTLSPMHGGFSPNFRNLEKRPEKYTNLKHAFKIFLNLFNPLPSVQAIEIEDMVAIVPSILGASLLAVFLIYQIGVKRYALNTFRFLYTRTPLGLATIAFVSYVYNATAKSIEPLNERINAYKKIKVYIEKLRDATETSGGVEEEAEQPEGFQVSSSSKAPSLKTNLEEKAPLENEKTCFCAGSPGVCGAPSCETIQAKVDTASFGDNFPPSLASQFNTLADLANSMQRDGLDSGSLSRANNSLRNNAANNSRLRDHLLDKINQKLAASGKPPLKLDSLAEAAFAGVRNALNSASTPPSALNLKEFNLSDSQGIISELDKNESLPKVAPAQSASRAPASTGVNDGQDYLDYLDSLNGPKDNLAAVTDDGMALESALEGTDWKAEQISKDTSRSIFEAISLRYKKSGYKSLLRKLTK